MVQKLLHYDVIRRLGDGAKSKIYSVVDSSTGRKYALKHVIRKEEKDIRYVEQMEAEFEVSRNFKHPNLRQCYELKISRSLILKVTEAFLVMELVEGQTIDVDMPRSLLEVTDIFLQTSEGLRAMHRLGYVHCDIKPINIMRTPSGLVKIIDFGQSTKSGTVKGRIQGTPDYIAPEQVARRPVTPQTDIFNLGASMYWGLTGRTIPTLYTVNKGGENSLLSHDLIQTPQQLNPNIPENMSRLVMDCVTTSPSKRPPNMDEVIQRLELVKHVLLKQQQPPVTDLPIPQTVTDGMVRMKLESLAGFSSCDGDFCTDNAGSVNPAPGNPHRRPPARSTVHQATSGRGHALRRTTAAHKAEDWHQSESPAIGTFEFTQHMFDIRNRADEAPTGITRRRSVRHSS